MAYTNRRTGPNFLVLAIAAALAGPAVAQPATPLVWRPLRVGAGGWLTGLDISPDGTTRVVRADTYGAWLWDAGRAEWQQLVTASSMPAEDVVVDNHAGVYEIRVAPSLPTRLYMAYRGRVYRSDNRGGIWRRTSFAPVAMDANDKYRMCGQKMAVSPTDADTVLVGAPRDGVFRTTDGGASWQRVAAIPKSAQAPGGLHPGHAGIACDARGAVYVSSYGQGVWRSTDGGVSFARLAGGPRSVSHGKLAADGAYYVTANDGAAVFRYASERWTEITPDKNNWGTVVVDPFDPQRVVAVREGGFLNVSRDRGATWDGMVWTVRREAQDVPWLAWTKESYMSEGDLLFDPLVKGRLWFAEGIGVWSADLPAKPTSVTWTSRSLGIEQLVANQVLAPPGGAPVVASWDRPVFRCAEPDAFPATHGPDREDAILMGWSVDYASTEPSFIAGLMNWGKEKSGYSTDGGRTWQRFPAYPRQAGKNGGAIAASTPRNLVWAPANNGVPHYTKDGGATWLPVNAPGAPTTGETGWGWAYYLNRRIVAADRVTPGTFYLYNYLRGLYRTTDGGDTWTLAKPGALTPFSGYNAKLTTVPGKAGHVFFTAGQLDGGNPVQSPLLRSTDGGATWAAVPRVLEVYACGFGKTAPGAAYPTIFVVGWVDGVYGVWRSDDEARTWVPLGAFPLGSLDQIKTIDGDKDTYGKVYVGFAGSGYAYGVLGP